MIFDSHSHTKFSADSEMKAKDSAQMFYDVIGKTARKANELGRG